MIGKTNAMNIIGGGGGDAQLNIVYSQTPPTDRTKIWVKSNEPDFVDIKSVVSVVSEQITTEDSQLATNNSNCCSATYQDNVYIFGGYNGTTYLNTIQKYNVITGTIETLDATIPNSSSYTGVADACCAAITAISSPGYGKIYIFGGRNTGASYMNDIRVFDVVEETCELLTNVTLTVPAYGACCTTVGGLDIYIFGGRGSSNSRLIQKFVPTNTSGNISNFGSSPQLGKAVFDACCSANGTDIYIFGGNGGQPSERTIQKLDTLSMQINTLSTMLPNYLSGATCVTEWGAIYVFGGAFSTSVYSSYIYRFDLEDETIETLSTRLVFAASNLCSATSSSSVFLFGGKTAQNSYINAIQEFGVQYPLAHNQALMFIDSRNPRFTLNLLTTPHFSIECNALSVLIGNAENKSERVYSYHYNGSEWVLTY